MSPSWRNAVRIGLSPDRLVLVRYRRGWRPVPDRSAVVAVPGAAANSHWQSAVEALPGALAGMDAARSRVSVVLSGHLVRYAVLPANEALHDGDEWLALARHRLESVHGSAAAGWEIRVSETTPRGPRVASAADRALLEALETSVTAAGATLAAVEPYLMAAFNPVRALVQQEGCWLVVEEPGRRTLALFGQGGWLSIRNRHAGHPEDEPLARSLEREAAALGLEAPCRQVLLHTTLAQESPRADDFSVRDVTLHGRLGSDPSLAMALA